VYSARKTIEEHKDRISSELTSEIERNIGDVEAALKTDDVDRIKTASEALKKALQGVGSAIYGQAAGADGGSAEGGFEGAGGYDGGGPDGESGAPHDENTVEGEYKEV
jgi:molecular chaperone DnaK